MAVVVCGYVEMIHDDGGWDGGHVVAGCGENGVTIRSEGSYGLDCD